MGSRGLATGQGATWDLASRLRRARLIGGGSALALIAAGPILAIATIGVLGPFADGTALRVVLLFDMVYILLVAGLVLARIVQSLAARRARSAGSRLLLRLTAMFAGLALVPTILVALFAGLIINIGLEGWFSDRVRNVVGSSLEAAEAYEREQIDGLAADAELLAGALDAARRRDIGTDDGALRVLLGESQGLIQRGLREAFVIDGAGEIRARGERSYLFDYDAPPPSAFGDAGMGGVAIVEDPEGGEFRALTRLDAFPDRWLWVSRAVDGELLGLLDDTKEQVALYQQLERERGRLLFDFGLLYLGFALVLVLAAIWAGMRFAETLSRPIGRLAGAAQRVGAGDFTTRVREEQGDDEIAMLGRMFNTMTRQLDRQRQSLLDQTDQVERRRRLFDSVLSSVTSGVVGLDEEGRVTFVNRAAERLLEIAADPVPLEAAIPEFGALWTEVAAGAPQAGGEVRLVRSGKQETLMVRLAERRGEEGALEGYVLAFDDVSDLVAAQRTAAWGDVARRIAHEIKNPLTPIQLSAQRIRRKFARVEGVDADALEQYTDVIVRQTEGLRRIVDEFSRFARMPEPERKPADLVALLSDAVLLQRNGQPGVTIRADLPDGAVCADVDEGMIGQALTNLMKNAGEATETLKESGEAPEGWKPQIRVSLEADERTALIRIADNGIGLPEDRAKLFEPYVTTRSEGTGLGLPIVKKIVTEHGGTLTLRDARPFGPGQRGGAEAVVELPVLQGAGEITSQEQKMAV
ncbi:two-component system nitrogen regulation sensor histidine kinase NtrY [Hasllibacter halocynthiae]|uniref:histidine kinase n=1 Tax=Hasllibacter halocynthiae TaxID=595589 RepID=A0A2T0X8B1_9RHOB|nr:two-component system nitrogen regulation sensor histidine kinase NtrY [Hasllibacter halocynthiae]